MKRCIFLFVLLALVACGDATPTSSPSATPASVGTTDSGQTVKQTFAVVMNEDLVRLELPSGQQTPITQLAPAEGAKSPALAPDGQTLAFAHRGVVPTPSMEQPYVLPTTDLALVPVDGGAVQVLYRDPEPQNSINSPAWSPDGKTIYATREWLVFDTTTGNLQDYGYSVLAIDVASGSATTLIEDGAFPAVSPDGTQLAFTRTTKDLKPTLLVYDLASGTERVVLDDPQLSAIEAPLWSADGQTLFFVAAPATTGSSSSSGLLSWFTTKSASAHGNNWKVHRIGVDGTGLQMYTTNAPMEDPRIALTDTAIFVWSFPGLLRYERGQPDQPPQMVYSQGDLGGIVLLP